MKLATTSLVFCVAALSALGLVMIFSASTWHQQARYLFWQPIWCGVGLVTFFAAASCNYRWFKKYDWLPWALLGVVVVLLALTRIPGIGKLSKGARRWLEYGGFRFQPSELAKIVVIIVLAYYGELYQRQMPQFIRGMVIPGAMVGLVIGLIFVEPDVGASVLIATVSCIILLIAGIRLRYFIPLVVLVGGLLGWFLANNEMRSDRIYSWLHLEETKGGRGMQVYQGLVALGSGGWTGVGLGDGRQKHGYVPEHHTDFILSVIGEELGLVATLGVILGFLGLLASGVYIAWHARDTFGMLMAAGLTFLIILQALVNIAVVTGSVPNKGLSLPFISYGGSNLVVMFGSIGLLISIARHAGDSRQLLPNAAEEGGVAGASGF